MILLAVSFSACSAAEEAGIGWGASKEEVIAIMGEPESEDNHSLYYYNEPVIGFGSKYNNNAIQFIFENNALLSKTYAIYSYRDPEKFAHNSVTPEDFSFLLAELESKYGKAGESEQILYSYITRVSRAMELEMSAQDLDALFHSGGVQYKTWTVENNTFVILLGTQNEDRYSITIIYCQADEQAQEQ